MQKVSRGFTLIELMTAVLVVSILFAVAIPSFREFTRNNRVTAAQNDLVTALTTARGEALRRSVPVTLCASTDSTSCSGDKNWETGWIAFTEADAGGTDGTVDMLDEVLQAWPAFGGDLKVAGDAAFIEYEPTGVIKPDAARSFQVYVNGCTGPHTRTVSLSAIGSMTSLTTDCP